MYMCPLQETTSSIRHVCSAILLNYCLLCRHHQKTECINSLFDQILLCVDFLILPSSHVRWDRCITLAIALHKPIMMVDDKMHTGPEGIVPSEREKSYNSYAQASHAFAMEHSCFSISKLPIWQATNRQRRPITSKSQHAMPLSML